MSLRYINSDMSEFEIFDDDHIMIEIVARNLETLFGRFFQGKLWDIRNHQISVDQDYFFKLFYDVLHHEKYNRELAQIFHHKNSDFVIPALLELRNPRIQEDVKRSLLFICKTIMTLRYEYAEYLTLLQLFCQSLKSSKPQDWMYDLCFANRTMTKNVITSIPLSLRYSGNHYNVPQMLSITKILIEHSAVSFDSDICELLIKSFHNTILNNLKIAREYKLQAIEIFFSLDSICCERNDAILCSMLDRFFHVAIKQELLLISDYIPNALLNKSETWIENSILSLETYLIPVDPILNTPNIAEDDWVSIIYLLEIAYHLKLNGIHFSIYEKKSSSILNKLSKQISIPHQFQLKIKVLMCNILSHTDWNAYKSLHVRSYFMTLNSFFLFSLNIELRTKAFESMMKIINTFPKKLTEAFHGESQHQFIYDLESCLKDHTTHQFSPERYKDLSSSLIMSFSFDELLNIIYLFDNLDNVLSAAAQISKFPNEFKQICAKSFLSSKQGTNNDVQKALFFLIFKNNKQTYGWARNVLTPRYPAPSPKLVRMYLFLLLKNPSEKALNETIDIGFVDSLRYNDIDIVSAFKTVFENYKIPDKFMIHIIDQLSNKNLILLQIIEQCSCIKLRIASYEHRFKLLEACVTGEPEIRQQFIKFFLSIENNDLTYEKVVFKNKSPYYSLFKSVEIIYILWESYERTSFWKYLTECALRHSELSDLLNQIESFVKHPSAERYVYIDRKLVLPVTKTELLLSNKDFQLCIKTKLNQHKNRMTFKKGKEEGKVKTITKGAKKKREEEEILKIKELEIDSKETRKFIVTVYPNGKKVTDDHEQSIEKELKNLKKLTPLERKTLFKTELMSKQSSSNYKERVIDMSLFIRQRIAIDIFKSTILGYHSVGLLVGLLFNAEIDFATASNQEIRSTISKYEVINNDLALRLFWWFANYLRLRNCTNALIKTKLKKVEKLLASTQT